MTERIVIGDAEVDTAVVAEYERTRRDLLRRGIATGGAAVAVAAIPLFLRVRNALAKADGDAEILEGAVRLEQTAVVAYATAAGSGKLDGETTRVARLFARQEQEHADGLIQALKQLGGQPPARPKSPDDVPGLAEAASGNQASIARFAVELETMALGAYYEASAKLRDPALVRTSASIMANEGQHLVVLRQALHRNPVPNAFETGGRSR
jgi:rubrerythrin